MSLTDYKLNDADIASKGVVSAPDRMLGTAQQNKMVFDRLIREAVKGLYNGLIDALAGAGGAGEIGVEQLQDVAGDNVQAALEALSERVAEKADGADVLAALALKSDKATVDAHLADTANPHGVTKAQVGLGSADNTSDEAKPLSAAARSALSLKQDALTFDTEPTLLSTNPVTSWGIRTALDAHYVTAGHNPGFAIGDRATAEGERTRASGTNAHAEGYMTNASGGCAHAEGINGVASGDYSHAEGSGSRASGGCAHAEGSNTVANHFAQHVFGANNVADDSPASGTQRGNYIEIVGNGTDPRPQSLSNARTLDWNGNERLAGKLTLGAAPTNDMDAATRKYVDDAVAAAIGAAIGGSY